MPLQIAQLGQPVLRQVAQPVAAEELHDPAFRQLIADMQETLAAAGGVGLAGPQVFASRRVFLAKIMPPAEEGGSPGVEVFINPQLSPLSDEVVAAWEGCLSFQELLVLVPRPRAVRVDYIDTAGQPRALALEGFPARVVQHEFDHLEGILTIDRAESTLDIIKASEIDAVLGDDAE
jgi:peptide deformylase